MAPASVLIIGAGPTGLVLGLSLACRGVSFRLVDENTGPGQHSRAMAVQARTLEFYRQFGFADEMIERGVKIRAIHLRQGASHGTSRELLRAEFADLGGRISPYPFAFAYPQDDHERFLIEKLAKAGCAVEWNTKLTGFTAQSNGVHVILDHGNGRHEDVDADYLCGCDGARSGVREILRLGFPGGTYEQLFYVADVEIAGGFERDLYVTLGKHILALMLPVRSSGMQRLIGLVPPELSARSDVVFDDVRGQVEPLLGIKVVKLNWYSTYRVHHRVAEHFKVGNVFLLGDAAHIHSPAGGQGMNAGIGDAINLGWKLAHASQGRAHKLILETYEPERIGYARTLVSTTDRAFTPLVAEGLLGEITRRVIAPLIFGLVTRVSPTRHALFRTLSQASVHYHESPLSEGQAGRLKGGDRLPWVGGAEDNFAPLQSLDWQVHVYGKAPDQLAAACGRLQLPVHVSPWSNSAHDAGLSRDAAYLIRPDGYVGLAAGKDIAEKLQRYQARFDLRFRAAPLDDC